MIKFFASIKQKVGRDSYEVDLDKPVKVGRLIGRLEGDLPGLKDAVAETRSLVAVNHEFGDEETIVKDGDELAFIPPMSGGRLVRIQTDDFNVGAEIAAVKKASANVGAVVTFLGTAREFSRGAKINELVFEHYPVMAEKKLSEIRRQALDKYDLLEVAIVHRYGNIPIGDNIVLIVVAASHRPAAFDACRWCIDELKRITPIWKKEVTDKGEVWVEEHP